jgi:hypothetical protein
MVPITLLFSVLSVPRLNKEQRTLLSSESVDREITESSEVQQLRVQLCPVKGSDYSRSNCVTADGSNCNCELC